MSAVGAHRSRVLAAIAALASTACGSDERTVLDPGACVAGEGVSARPSSIAETVQLINSMPRPLSISCFLRALERPLSVHATTSPFSAQPAPGPENPRLFLFIDPLYLSVVPDGESRDLLELSELTSNTRSVKAEILFPVTEEFPLPLAYERVLDEKNGDRTSCGLCHGDEQPVDADGPAFESSAIKPPPLLRVELDVLTDQSEKCEVTQGNDPCDMLRSLFLYGPVEDHEFPEEMALFF